MHEALLASDAQLTDDYVLRQARAMGLNAQRLSACATADRYEAAITRNANAAAALGIQGTPTFIIGRSQPRELRGERLGGAQPYEAFDAVLKRLLAQD
jgi:predicted DsbA family dithiol-disulfide isomerase